LVQKGQKLVHTNDVGSNAQKCNELERLLHFFSA
jgi:hypothetical protein